MTTQELLENRIGKKCVLTFNDKKGVCGLHVGILQKSLPEEIDERHPWQWNILTMDLFCFGFVEARIKEISISGTVLCINVE